MFTIQVNIHHTGPVADAVASALRELARRVDELSRLVRAEGKVLMKEIDDLQAAVQKNADAENSAIVLIKGIADQLKNAGTDPAKIAQLASQLNDQADALAAAVVANTPAA